MFKKKLEITPTQTCTICGHVFLESTGKCVPTLTRNGHVVDSEHWYCMDHSPQYDEVHVSQELITSSRDGGFSFNTYATSLNFKYIRNDVPCSEGGVPLGYVTQQEHDRILAMLPNDGRVGG